METKRLKQFCVILETGSLSKAATLLHITHSGLSKAMKLLQAELGCQLFRPAGRGLEPTEMGYQIYEQALTFLRHETQFFNFKLQPTQSTLKIGCAEIFIDTFTQQFAHASYAQDFFQLQLIEPGFMEQMLIDKQLDFGISYAPYPHPHLDITEIATFRLGCYYLRNTFEKTPLSDIPFAVPANQLANNPLGIRDRDGWLDSLYPRYKKYAVNHLSIALQLCLQGLCAIHIPDFIATRINATRKSGLQLIERGLPKMGKAKQTVYLLHAKDGVSKIMLKKIIPLVKNSVIAI